MSNLDKPAMPTEHIPGGWRNQGDLSEGLTIRQHAALTLRVPMSGDAELDAMIREARRLDMATAAMQGLLANGVDIGDREQAQLAFKLGDALLAASEPKKADKRDDANTCTKCGHWNGGPVLCEHYAEEAERRERERQAQPDAEGWIEWHGGECPVQRDVRVEVKLRDGEQIKRTACDFDWSCEEDPQDIIAYRAVKGD